MKGTSGPGTSMKHLPDIRLYWGTSGFLAWEQRRVIGGVVNNQSIKVLNGHWGIIKSLDDSRLPKNDHIDHVPNGCMFGDAFLFKLETCEDGKVKRDECGRAVFADIPRQFIGSNLADRLLETWAVSR